MTKILITPGSAQRERLWARPRIAVHRANRTYLEDKGWSSDGVRYRGLYRTSHGNWLGEVEQMGSHLEYFIFNPPQKVLQGPHGSCFQHIGDNWWWVHFAKESYNPSDGILAVERTIQESFR